jgi:hypothetical protein
VNVLLTAAVLAATLPGGAAEGPTCEAGLCAEYVLTESAMYAYGSFDQPDGDYAELVVTLNAFTKGSTLPVTLAATTVTGTGRLEATTDGRTGGYLAVFACAEVPPLYIGDEPDKVCDT